MATNTYSHSERVAAGTESAVDTCDVPMKCISSADKEEIYDNIPETHTYQLLRNINESASSEYAATSFTSYCKKDEGTVKERVNSLSHKRFICILVLMAAAVLAASICFVAVFVKVAIVAAEQNTDIETLFNNMRCLNIQLY